MLVTVQEKNVVKKSRNSSIELLKILAIIFIVISHAAPLYGDTTAISYIDLSKATKDVGEFILIIIRTLGQVGNIIFVMCTAYFLIDSKNVKPKKILYVLSDCFIISMLFLLVYIICVDDLSVKTIIKQFLPTTFGNNWFIGCYLLLYIIHPYLNCIIKSGNQRNLLRINIFLIIIYCGIAFFIKSAYYYTQLVGFIVIYFIVAYNKIYLVNFNKNRKLNVKLLFLGISLFILSILATNILGLKIELFKNKMLYWSELNNIFIIIIGLTLLNLFITKTFQNKAINYISSLSLLIYITSENKLFRFYVKPLFYQHVFQYGYILFWVILEAIMLFIFGLVTSSIYKYTLSKIVYKVTDKIYILLNKLWNKVEPMLLKLN